MCRLLAYLGNPVRIDDLLYQPDRALIHQTYMPKMIRMLNLAGFGMAAWDPQSLEPAIPFTYYSSEIPVFDRNLKGFARKIQTPALIAHIRGVAYHGRETVGEQNLHPFLYEGYKLALAHNGELADFAQMRFSLVPYLKPVIAARIRGNTDSEWIYALFLSQFENPAADHSVEEISEAVIRLLRILRTVREQHGINTSSSVNLVISDGSQLVAVRFAFDFGCYSLDPLARIQETAFSFLSMWYTRGGEYGYHDGEWKMIGGQQADSIIISSEPLTDDFSTWLEVPEYSILHARRTGETLQLGRIELEA